MTSALNARTAAEAIRQREFDLVLLDINLPDGNGFELCKLIKPQHPDTIVIFLTANDQESDQIRGYDCLLYTSYTPYACYVTFPHYYDTTIPPFCPQNAKK